jgi:hypothetical protein
MLTSLINKGRDALQCVSTRFTGDLQQIDWPRTGLLCLFILAAFFALMQCAMPQIREITTTEFRRVREIRTVESVKRVLVPCPEKGIVALDKAAVAKKLNLTWLQGGDIAQANTTPQPNLPQPPPKLGGGAAGGGDPVPGNPADLQVTATADLPESKAGYQVVTVFNTETGVTENIAKEKLLPWFAFENHGSASAWYGYNQQLLNVVDLDARWQFLRIKQVHLGLRGAVGSDGDKRIQAGTIWEW